MQRWCVPTISHPHVYIRAHTHTHTHARARTRAHAHVHLRTAQEHTHAHAHTCVGPNPTSKAPHVAAHQRRIAARARTRAHGALNIFLHRMVAEAFAYATAYAIAYASLRQPYATRHGPNDVRIERNRCRHTLTKLLTKGYT